MPLKESMHLGGKYLRELRKAQRMTQMQLGKALGFTSDKEISYFEHGNKKRMPGVDELLSICQVLKVDSAQQRKLLVLYGFQLGTEVADSDSVSLMRLEKDAELDTSISHIAGLIQIDFEKGMLFVRSLSKEDELRFTKAVDRIQKNDPERLITKENLPKMLDYSPRFIKGAFDEDERELRLFRNSIQCFEKLFPDPRDRCSEKDLKQWLREDYKEEYTNKWRSVYAVLHADDDVFGMAYLSVHLDSSWAYVSYLGILQGWRTLDRANKFIKYIIKHIQTNILSTLKGLVFEIDPIDFSYLKDLGKLSSVLVRDNFDEKALSNLRSMKRLHLFQHYESSVVLGRDGLPLPVWQPPLTKPLDASKEKELILMVRPINEGVIKDIELQEVLDFVYDILYMDAYNTEDNEVYIVEFHHYVAEVKRRVEAKAQEGWNIKPLEIPKEIDRLFTCAKILGLEDELDL